MAIPVIQSTNVMANSPLKCSHPTNQDYFKGGLISENPLYSHSHLYTTKLSPQITVITSLASTSGVEAGSMVV